VDLDAYVLAHHADWSRLEELLGRRRLDGDEADELVERYQQVATHLSVLRSAAPDPTLVAHLSSLLARARNKSLRPSLHGPGIPHQSFAFESNAKHARANMHLR